MGTELYRGRFERLARALSRDYGLEVRWSAGGARMDGKTLYLPANADNLSDIGQRRLHGMVDHEALHFEEEMLANERHTLSPLVAMRNQADRRIQLLMNAFEDIRIETRAAAERPGTAENLAFVNIEALAKHAADPRVEQDFWRALGIGIIAKARGFDHSWLSPTYQAALRIIDDEIRAAPLAKSIIDVIALAKSVVDKMEKAAEQAPTPQPQSDDEGEPSDDDEGDGTGSAEADGDEGDDNVDDVEASGGDDDSESMDGEDDKESAGDGEDEHGSDDGEGADDSDGDEEPNDAESDSANEDTDEGELSDADADGAASSGDRDADDVPGLTEEMVDSQPSVTDLVDVVRDEVAKEANDEVCSSKRWAAKPEVVEQDSAEVPSLGSPAIYNTHRDIVLPMIAPLRAKLRAILLSRQASHFVGDLDEGVLDRSALPTIRTGNTRLFAQQVESVRIGAAVQLVVDMSGSMVQQGHGSVRRCYLAYQSVIALADTFDKLNIPFEVLGYSSDGYWSGGYTPHAPRQAACHMRVIKSFDERWNSVKLRASVITHPQGSTDDYYALDFAARRIMSRPESRKLVLMINDGIPEGCGPESTHHEALRALIRRLSKHIEITAVGMDCPGVRNFYNENNGARCCVIQSTQELPVEVYKVMRTALLRAA